MSWVHVYGTCFCLPCMVLLLLSIRCVIALVFVQMALIHIWKCPSTVPLTLSCEPDIELIHHVLRHIHVPVWRHSNAFISPERPKRSRGSSLSISELRQELHRTQLRKITWHDITNMETKTRRDGKKKRLKGRVCAASDSCSCNSSLAS